MEITDTTEPTSSTAKFGDRLRLHFAKADTVNVSEEELFASIVGDKVAEESGTQDFTTLFNAALSRTSNGRAGVGHEDAAKEALRELVGSGSLAETTAQKIYSESFAAAQLDSDTSKLYDGFGGANDPTVALASLADALRTAETQLTAFDAGEVTAPLRHFDDPSNSTQNVVASLLETLNSSEHDSEHDSGPISETFLYKPISDSDGNIAILTPASLTGRVEEVILRDKNGTELEKGRYGGNGNGGREHFRFQEPGSAYRSPLTVEIRLDSGSLESYQIIKPNERFED